MTSRKPTSSNARMLGVCERKPLLSSSLKESNKISKQGVCERKPLLSSSLIESRRIPKLDHIVDIEECHILSGEKLMSSPLQARESWYEQQEALLNADIIDIEQELPVCCLNERGLTKSKLRFGFLDFDEPTVDNMPESKLQYMKQSKYDIYHLTSEYVYKLYQRGYFPHLRKAKQDKRVRVISKLYNYYPIVPVARKIDHMIIAPPTKVDKEAKCVFKYMKYVRYWSKEHLLKDNGFNAVMNGFDLYRIDMEYNRFTTSRFSRKSMIEHNWANAQMMTDLVDINGIIDKIDPKVAYEKLKNIAMKGLEHVPSCYTVCGGILIGSILLAFLLSIATSVTKLVTFIAGNMLPACIVEKAIKMETRDSVATAQVGGHASAVFTVFSILSMALYPGTYGIRNATDFFRSAKFSGDFFSDVGHNLQYGFAYVMAQCTGDDSWLGDDALGDAHNVMDRVVELRMRGDVLSLINSDDNVRAEVIYLQRYCAQHDKFLNSASAFDPTLGKRFAANKAWLLDLYTNAMSSGSRMSVRKEPLSFLLQGKPNQGKSTLVNIVLSLLHKIYITHHPQESDSVVNRRYSKPNSSQYAEGYTNQFAWVWDELFASRAADDLIRDAVTMIDLVNTQACPLDMAFNRKGCVFMTSDVVISTTNFDAWESIPIQSTEALTRRFHVPIEVTRGKEFSGSDISGIEGCWTISLVKAAADNPKLFTGVPSSLRELLKEPVDITVFLKWLVDYYEGRLSETTLAERAFDYDRLYDILTGKEAQPQLFMSVQEYFKTEYLKGVSEDNIIAYSDEFDYPDDMRFGNVYCDEKGPLSLLSLGSQHILYHIRDGIIAPNEVIIHHDVPLTDSMITAIMGGYAIIDEIMFSDETVLHTMVSITGLYDYLMLKGMIDIQAIQDVVYRTRDAFVNPRYNPWMNISTYDDHLVFCKMWGTDVLPESEFNRMKGMYLENEMGDRPGLCEQIMARLNKVWHKVVGDDGVASRMERALADTILPCKTSLHFATQWWMGKKTLILNYACLWRLHWADNKYAYATAFVGGVGCLAILTALLASFKKTSSPQSDLSRYKKLNEKEKHKFISEAQLCIPGDGQSKINVPAQIRSIKILYHNGASAWTKGFMAGKWLVTTGHPWLIFGGAKEFTVYPSLVKPDYDRKGGVTVYYRQCDVRNKLDDEEARDICLLYHKTLSRGVKPGRLVAPCSYSREHVYARINFKGAFREMSSFERLPSAKPYGMRMESRFQTAGSGVQSFYHDNSYILYDQPGLNGDCGNFIINSDGLILGLHIATLGSDGVYAPVYAEDLESSGVAQVGYIPEHSGNCFECDGTTACGMVERRMSTEPNSPYIKTILNDRGNPESDAYVPPVFNCTRVPARMDHVDGNSPWFKHNSDYSRTGSPPIDDSFMAFLKVKPRFLWEGIDRLPRNKYHKMLTFEESLDGFDRSTSSGLLGKVTGLNRRDLLETNEGLKVLEDAVNEYRTLAHSGSIPCMPVIENLKVELKEKGKYPRVFLNNDFAHAVWTKMVMGDVVLHLKSHFGLTGFMCGVNPHGRDWNFVHDYILGDKRLNIIGGDISNMDLSCHPVFPHVFFKYMNTFYMYEKGTPEYIELRACCLSISYQLRFRKRRKFWVWRGHSSGHYLTTLYNSFVIYCTHRWVYYKAGLDDDYGRFKDVIKLLTYGDDSLGSVPDPIRDRYNMRVIQQGLMKYFGMIYTDPDKRDDIPEFLDRKDVTFLSRSFTWMDGRLCPRLGMDSIYGMLLWVKKNPNVTPDDQLRQNVEVACMEMMYYGEDAYREFVHKVRARFIDRNFEFRFPEIDKYRVRHDIHRSQLVYSNCVKHLQ